MVPSQDFAAGDARARAAGPPGGTPVTLLRSAATVLPRVVLDRIAAAVIRRLEHARPRLLDNLARLEPAVVHIAPVDLPYRFELRVGRMPVSLAIIDAPSAPASPAPDAEVAASVATLVDLLEGRIDSDTLFFRRDLTICGNTSVVVGLRNVVDREELSLGDELAGLLGPLGNPARALARRLDHALDRIGARAAAMHRTLHPQAEQAQDVSAELERCRAEITALTARMGKLEARLKRRDEKPA
jgi:predicted lipid carrier protein YhbT